MVPGTDLTLPPPQSLCPARLVQLRVDRARGPGREARPPLQLFLGRRDEPLGGAEVSQDRAASGRSDALQRVEDRLERTRVAAAAVVPDREPVRLVPDPLQELQPGVMGVEPDRIRAT